jgi:titin
VVITAPSNASQGVTSYFVGAYNGGGTLITSNTGGPSTLNYTLSSFTAGTTYTIKANAVNSGGIGPSNSTTITYYTKPAAPTNVVGALRSVGATTYIDLSFTASADTGGGALMYYATAVDVSSIQTNVAGSGSASPISLSTGLVVGTTYRFTVYCQNPSVSSDVSMGASNLYYYVIPTAPQSVVPSLYPVGNPTSMRITFNPITTVGGITNYTSYAYTQPGGTLLTSLTNPGTTHYLSSFTAGTQYDIRVNATNPAGTGPLSVSTLLTYYTKPGAPTITSLTLDPASAPTGINVAFTAPANTGGGISNYVASAFNGVTYVTSTIGTTTPLKLTSLTVGTTYTFSVAALNPGGSSIQSNTQSLLYQVQPSSVTSLIARNGPVVGPTAIGLSWVAPTNTGGSAIASYRIQQNANYYSTTATSFTAGALSPITYTFAIYPINSGGLIGPSTNISQYPLSGVPGNFSGYQLASGTARLTWNAVTDTTPVVNLYRVKNIDLSNTTRDTTNAYYDWSGLTNGQGYRFAVAASNDGGTTFSAYTGAALIMLDTPLVAITTLSAVDAGSGKVNLTWSAPSGGTNITNYRVSYDYGSSWSNVGNVTSYSNWQLATNTPYNFAVEAYNYAGWSPLSNIVPLTLLPAPTGSITYSFYQGGYDYIGNWTQLIVSIGGVSYGQNMVVYGYDENGNNQYELYNGPYPQDVATPIYSYFAGVTHIYTYFSARVYNMSGSVSIGKTYYLMP